MSSSLRWHVWLRNTKSVTAAPSLMKKKRWQSLLFCCILDSARVGNITITRVKRTSCVPSDLLRLVESRERTQIARVARICRKQMRKLCWARGASLPIDPVIHPPLACTCVLSRESRRCCMVNFLLTCWFANMFELNTLRKYFFLKWSEIIELATLFL